VEHPGSKAGKPPLPKPRHPPTKINNSAGIGADRWIQA
jgi:hypothetical protein